MGVGESAIIFEGPRKGYLMLYSMVWELYSGNKIQLMTNSRHVGNGKGTIY